MIMIIMALKLYNFSAFFIPTFFLVPFKLLIETGSGEFKPSEWFLAVV